MSFQSRDDVHPDVKKIKIDLTESSRSRSRHSSPTTDKHDKDKYYRDKKHDKVVMNTFIS